MKCPYCAETIKNEALKCKHCSEWVKGNKQCPSCAESIRAAARVCKHCGAQQTVAVQPADIAGDLRDVTEAARRFAGAMPDSLNHMSIVTQCIAACRAYFGDEDPSPADTKEFVEAVAEIKKWSETSARSRKSEVGTIVSQHRRLPSACKAVVADKRYERFTWHDAVRVARLCKTNSSNKAVVMAFYKTKSAK